MTMVGNDWRCPCCKQENYKVEIGEYEYLLTCKNCGHKWEEPNYHDEDWSE